MTNLSDVGPTTTTASICQFLCGPNPLPRLPNTHTIALPFRIVRATRDPVPIPIESSAAGGCGFRLHACAPARSG